MGLGLGGRVAALRSSAALALGLEHVVGAHLVRVRVRAARIRVRA